MLQIQKRTDKKRDKITSFSSEIIRKIKSNKSMGLRIGFDHYNGIHMRTYLYMYDVLEGRRQVWL